MFILNAFLMDLLLLIRFSLQNVVVAQNILQLPVSIPYSGKMAYPQQPE